MKATVRRLLAVTALTGLAVSLAACGPRNAEQTSAAGTAVAVPAAQPGWSTNDLATLDPAVLGSSAPLPQALPMRASYSGSYRDAPVYDYPSAGPASFAPDAAPDDYQWLGMAAALAGMLGDAPPDYAFGYDGVQPWAWETGDRYLRYAEPVSGGYRYYYYQPDSARPFLISDPYYSYGYSDDRLVTIYDRSGRVIDARRADRQRRAAQTYFARAEAMYQAAHRERRFGVAGSLWQRHRDEIARKQRQWDEARRRRQAWQRWDAGNGPRLQRDWAGEALVRRQAETRFAGWQKVGFRTPAPRLYSDAERRAQLQKVAQIRRERAHKNELARREAIVRSQHRQQQTVARNLAQRREQLAEQQQQDEARLSRERQVRQNAQHRAQVAEVNSVARQKVVLRQVRQAAKRKAQLAKAAEQRAARTAAVHKAQLANAAAARAKAAKARQARLAAAQKQQAAHARQAAERKAQLAKAAERKSKLARAARAREAAQARQASRRRAEQAKAAKFRHAIGHPSRQGHASPPPQRKVQHARKAALAGKQGRPAWKHARN